jgi:hypothetical protein
MGTPFPINQAKMGAPSSQGRTLSYQSGKIGHALLTRARPFLSIKQCAKNLEWMEELPNLDQLAGTERGLCREGFLFLPCNN